VPESKGRKEAEAKRKSAKKEAVASERAEKQRLGASLTGTRGWVAPTFVTLMLLGVLWLVVWYITTVSGVAVPGMSALGSWNLVIGMGLMGASFGIATLWK
jgi:hypothetical protein